MLLYLGHEIERKQVKFAIKYLLVKPEKPVFADITCKAAIYKCNICIIFDKPQTGNLRFHMSFDGEKYKILLSHIVCSTDEIIKDVVAAYPNLENQFNTPLDFDACELVLKTLKFKKDAIDKMFKTIHFAYETIKN